MSRLQRDSRGRGSPQGVQRTTRAHGVLLSTGEAPATSFTNDGGTRARTLCLWGSPFGGAGTPKAVRRYLNCEFPSASVLHQPHRLRVRLALDTPAGDPKPAVDVPMPKGQSHAVLLVVVSTLILRPCTTLFSTASSTMRC